MAVERENSTVFGARFLRLIPRKMANSYTGGQHMFHKVNLKRAAVGAAGAPFDGTCPSTCARSA